MVEYQQPVQTTTEIRNRRREKRLWEQSHFSLSLGCPTCPQFTICGGLHTLAGLFDCMGHCCRSPENCSNMCRLKSAEFVQRIREINGFGLENVSRSEPISTPALPSMVPLIYHGNRRSRLYDGPAIALSLHRLIHRESGQPKFSSEVELRREFRISPKTVIVLSGTDQDPPLERWWGYGDAARLKIINSIKALGISLVTTPNYSLFANRPRWDDLHSLKRIAITNSEFLQVGLPAALHVNARSDADQKRWTIFVQERPEITHLAYEFTTGSGRVDRRRTHAKWLSNLAKNVDRPLTIIVRGCIDVLPILSESFRHVVFLETSAFMKTMKRQSAQINGNKQIGWEPAPTQSGEELDDLFEHNVRRKGEFVRMLST